MTNNGKGLINAIVSLTDSSGNVRTARTGLSGRNEFVDVAASETFVLSVKAVRHAFEAQALSIDENTKVVNFIVQ